ncbi:carbohydrate ABC transporter permease [Paenibacillus flagellatus]|uniref:ABC transporter permease n=1 Tax=Paenibacillus flagellatus TaxID=2211139 RepID=A0A2V5JYI2_9BACL|nr:carbohydrate ABC transporter permease [Paenibacillus flagellatus]PYI51352.1 ABC transporter permease [Paenibacillus flagellatus]
MNAAASHGRKRSVGAIVGIAAVSLVLIGYFLIVAYPLFWMIMSSFKETKEIYGSSWSLPTKWFPSNYAKAWTMGVSKYFMNSVVVTSCSVVLTVLLSAFSAYGLSRFSFKGKYVVLALLSAGMMFSPQVSLIPLYKLVQTIGIHDTHWALILPYVAFRTSMTVLLIRSFFLQIPKELEESAYLEGCSSLGIFFRIFIPMSKPIIWTTVLLTAYWTWNEFLFAIIFIDSDSVKTITSGLLAFRDALYTDWGVLMAGLVISALPLVLLFVFMQKHFVRGLAEGGVKG